MNNGFLINIINISNIAKDVILLNAPLPDGIFVQTEDERYDPHGLRQAALIRPFNGNTLTTNADQPIHIDIVGDRQTEEIILNGRYEGPQITIDGQDHFLKVRCPSNSAFYLRLNDLPIDQ